MKASEERITYAQIIAQRQQQEHEREAEMKAWIASVTERLMNEQSKFLQEFDENEKRILGLINTPR